MTEKETQTEDKIIEAARAVFIEKGMAGARMQEIADKANINKSLLHYYFRSKEKLFDAVFAEVIGEIGGMFGIMMKQDVSIDDKLKLFVSTYIDVIQQNPFLPNFILTEIARDPEGLINRVKPPGVDITIFLDPINKQLKAEGYSIKALDFIINLLSMVIFPLAVKPVLQRLLFQSDEETYKVYMNSRKESVVTFIMNALSGYKI